jgi:hypothetical protein
MLALLLVSACGCSRNPWLDFAMSSAPHVAGTSGRRVGPYEVLAGDMHCHVEPPDSRRHVSRELAETVRLAEDEGLDFVVLTPHVPARFFLDPEKREWVRGTQTALRAEIDAISSNVLLVQGMEYTDHRFGHAGLSFANVDEVLDELPLDQLTANPALFFERWQAHGGITVLNHPTLRPLASAPLAELRSDLSWRGFTARTEPTFFPEVAWLSEHADAVEIWNLSIGHLRDRYFVGDPEWTLRSSAQLALHEARRQERRIAQVGGTDSHGAWLRPTTWVLATERTKPSIREAIVAGRTCVRGPEACSFEVRGADGAFHVAGASVASPPPPQRTAIAARAYGGPVTYYVNGVAVAEAAGGEVASVPVPGRCALVRAVVGESWSGPVYVDCAWAERRAPAL